MRISENRLPALTIGGPFRYLRDQLKVAVPGMDYDTRLHVFYKRIRDVGAVVVSDARSLAFDILHQPVQDNRASRKY